MNWKRSQPGELGPQALATVLPHPAQQAVVQVRSQLYSSTVAQRWQPMLDHRPPCLLIWEVNQNPLLQPPQHGRVQLPASREEESPQSANVSMRQNSNGILRIGRNIHFHVLVMNQ